MGIFLNRMRRFLCCCGVVAVLIVAGPVLAEEGRFYIGGAATVEWLDASYDKIVENRPPSPRCKEVSCPVAFQEKDSADKTGYGFGFLAGYRMPLNERFYVGGEVDLTLHDGTARGQLDGVGTSPGRNQPGESWPDSWSFGKDVSYGLTVRLGVRPDFLQLWEDEASVYVLAGVRHVKARFTIDSYGCLLSETQTTDCSPSDPYTAGRQSHTLSFNAWTSGVGLEKMIGPHAAIQGEVRYTGYPSQNWTSFDLGSIRVPVDVDNDEVNLLLKMVWYF